jgi:uncharacterized protein YdhG (YjbR/CyaY superfamily)
MNAKPTTAEEYVATFPPDIQAILRNLRETIYATIPDAAETIRYAMPAVMLNGHYVVHYGAWKHHIGLYPIPPMPVELEPEVAPYRSTKDTMRLPYKTALPSELLQRVLAELVKQREVETRQAAPKRKTK